jgi:hypothetical protein
VPPPPARTFDRYSSALVSGGRGNGAGAIGLGFARQTVLESAAEYQQASVLAGVEWVRHASARPTSEAIRLVVVAGPLAVKRSDGPRRLLRLKCHVSRGTPCSDPEGTPGGF